MSKKHHRLPESVWTLDAWIQRTREADELRQRALDIKESGDRRALELAREIQTYKDEKANELRSQIERERGAYVTRNELTAAVEKIEVQMSKTSNDAWTRVLAIAAIMTSLGLGLFLGLR